MQARSNGVFTTALVRDGQPHHLGLHLARLVESARIVGLPQPTPDAVRRRVTVALTAPDAPTTAARMRLDWDGTEATVAIAPFAGHPRTTTVLRAPDPRESDSPTAGAKTDALGSQGRALVAWAQEHGAGETLLATTAGLLCEGATSNVFYVVDGELRTPTLHTGLLNGIARQLLLDATGAVEVDAPYDVLGRADEVFLTSSLRGVQPVTAVDGREIGGPGPVTRAAQQAWAALATDD
ncbi:aminotransferase class IV [Nocardioides jejuensis]|uniref:4-amino-4-deoxychorismate lyase n=1 Tax=Nocardioides jejuensis TaxID=2502782 RepID=A0A4R1CD84_9ACTN|nr:aminotransferase class IV [Nocardioides jejuensis]TCJ28959.1 4-amino-4-deoxychorismate lyase [Nocardioides jejuensis]